MAAQSGVQDFLLLQIEYKKTIPAGMNAHIYEETNACIVVVLLTESDGLCNFLIAYFFGNLLWTLVIGTGNKEQDGKG